MGMDPDGILVYGYALGGPEEGWKIDGLAKWGSLITPWYRCEDDDCESTDEDEGDDDFATLADRQLLIAHGFTEGHPGWGDDVTEDARYAYYARRKAAEKAIGVEVSSCGGNEYPSFLLRAYRVSAEWSETVVIDWPALEARRVAEDWDGRLAAALIALGLKPLQDRPQWLLTSAYG